MAKLIYKSIMMFGILLCTFAAIAQSKFYNRDGRFKIMFSTTPQTQTFLQPTAVGDVTVYMFTSTLSSGKTFLVSYVDYPASQMAGKDNKLLLDLAKSGFVENLKLSVSDSMYMNYAKHQGIMFHANNGKTFVSFRDYMVDNRLYQLGILQYSVISDQDENDFFDSFELVK